MRSVVALTQGGNRSENIDKALRFLEKDIDLSGKSDVFIKVNFVSSENRLAVTHVDGVRTLLKFLRERYSGDITICESTLYPAKTGFEKFGYPGLVDEFDVSLIDLNEMDWEIIDVFDSRMNPVQVHFSRRLLESDYLISIGPSKTHDMVVVTLSIKNVVMGGVSYKHNDKAKIHQGYPVMNLNLYLMATHCLPDLSIIDGFTGMEGDGPVTGNPVDWGIAVASCDAVAADCLAAGLMGFDVSNIGYLWYLREKGYGAGDISQMEIVGESPDRLRRSFKPHSTYSRQIEWHDKDIEKFLKI